MPGWRLTYDLRGFPFVEPAFADIEKLLPGDDTPEVQGVCHQITRHEWEGIKATEGGGGVIEQGYHVVHVNPVPLRGDNTPIKAVSLAVGDIPVIKHNGNCHLPSRRYLNLLAEGAKHYQLEPQYVDWLESHQGYKRTDHVPSRIVFYIAMCFIGLLIIPVFSLFALNGKLRDWLAEHHYAKAAWFIHTVLRKVSHVVWAWHDTLLWVFGRFGWIKVTRAGNKGVLCIIKEKDLN